VSTSTSQRTFRNPSSATLAPLGGRPIAIRWLGAPEEDGLDIPPDVDMAASYSGVGLDDGRIILTPTGEPLERMDPSAQPATKEVASASQSARSTPAPSVKKAARATAAAPAKARGAAASSSRSKRAPGRPAKASARQPRKRG
jgi:hypothetical protein